jgi:hypothetical protein
MIRFFRAGAYYSSFYQSYYLKNKNTDINIPYEESLKNIFNQKILESDFFKENLLLNEGYICEEVLSNDEVLQKKWALQNNVYFDQSNWYFQILKSQLLKFKPNVFYIGDQKILSNNFINEIRNEIPELKLLIVWDGIDAAKYELFKLADIVLTPAEFITKKYLSNGFKSYTLPFAFDESILSMLKTNNSKVNVSFVGQISLFENGHFGRKDLLLFLKDKVNIDLHLSGNTNIYKKPISKETLTLIKNVGFKSAYEVYKLGELSNDSLYGMDMYQKFYDSRIVLNKHIDLAKDNAANIRLFEATGVGSCLLTDYKANIEEYFQIDKEVMVYKDSADCLNKINFLLRNEKIRNSIAEAGQKRTLERYNYKIRMKKLSNIIFNNLNGI